MRQRSIAQAEAPPFWALSLAELQSELRSDARGLSSAEAARRRAVHGDNALITKRRRALGFDYLLHFRNPLVLLLLGATVVSAALQDVTSAALVALIVIGSVTLDFVQERRAGNAAERLRQSVAARAAVLRDGAVVRVAAVELVPGDVVQLAAGDLVPADGRVLDARDFFIDQALLTGESFPVEKQAADLPRTAVELAAASNAAFTGSSVISGSAHLLVARTGRSTYLGDVAASLHMEPAPTAFELGTRRFGYLILQMTFVLVLFVVFVNLAAHRPLIETLLFAVALAVGLTPELLPMIVSVTLARGALRMARSKVIVKRLAAIQNLGSMDVLCTDKTGTLTEGAIRLERHLDAAGRDSARVLLLAYLNSYFESGLRNPMDEAILVHQTIDTEGWRKVDEVPFGFERRRVSVLLQRAAERLLVVKGAPEDMLRLAVSYEDGDAVRTLDDAARHAACEQFEALSRAGFRVLAVAWRKVPPEHAHAVIDDETQLVLCGFAAFLDPPKASAGAALQQLQRRNVRVKVVTGDNEWVTQQVCMRVGLPVTGVLTGAQIDKLDDRALAVQAQRANLFCRVSPPQKSRVLQALRRRGHVVGFLGDGVNDAPSLHNADVSISVDSAVDVAKEAADMILLEHDLGVLHDGVIEGRRTFANVMKYIMMGTSSSFGNMFSMAGASLFLPFLPMLPVQILLNNLLYDASEVTLPLDRVDAEYLRRPHDWDPGFIRRFMLTLGPVSSLFDFITFAVLFYTFQAAEALFRTGWFIESIATQTLVVFVIRTRGSPWHSRPHPALAGAAIAVVLVAVLLPFTPLADAFGFVAPPGELLLLIAALVVVYLACAEAAKRWFYRAPRRRRDAAVLESPPNA